MSPSSISLPVSSPVSLATLERYRGGPVPAWGVGSSRVDPIHFAGRLDLLCWPTVAVVGSRSASDLGLQWARLASKALVELGATVLSGLARGIDAQAHCAALAAGGRTAAMLGTPTDRAYPYEHAALQARLGAEHLLLSPFASGAPIRKGNFVVRNRVMAALCDAALVVEAKDGSGSLTLAAACLRLQRPVFFPRWLVMRSDLNWPKQYLSHPGVFVIDQPRDIVQCLGTP